MADIRRFSIQTVALNLFRFNTALDRLWVFGQMATARRALRNLDGIRFWKLCGSGTGEGFTPVPNTAVWAILTVWDDEDTAYRKTQTAPIFQRWRDRAIEDWALFLNPTSSRGAWSNSTPFSQTVPSDGGPIAVLTRATLKPSVIAKFWSQTPAISDVIGADPNVIFKIGIGEVPWLQQVTFSIWPDTASMTNFARREGPHARAVKAVRDGGWFREELYARFNVLGSAGRWDGRDPLVPDERSAA